MTGLPRAIFLFTISSFLPELSIANTDRPTTDCRYCNTTIGQNSIPQKRITSEDYSIIVGIKKLFIVSKHCDFKAFSNFYFVKDFIYYIILKKNDSNYFFFCVRINRQFYETLRKKILSAPGFIYNFNGSYGYLFWVHEKNHSKLCMVWQQTSVQSIFIQKNPTQNISRGIGPS